MRLLVIALLLLLLTWMVASGVKLVQLGFFRAGPLLAAPTQYVATSQFRNRIVS